MGEHLGQPGGAWKESGVRAGTRLPAEGHDEEGRPPDLEGNAECQRMKGGHSFARLARFAVAFGTMLDLG